MRLDAEYRDFVLERERERRESELRQQGLVLADVMKSVFEKAIGNALPPAKANAAPAAQAAAASSASSLADGVPTAMVPFPPIPPMPAMGAVAPAAPVAPAGVDRVRLPSEDDDEVTPEQLRLLAAELQHKVTLTGLTSRRAAEEVILQKCIEDRTVVKLIGEIYSRYGARMVPRATINRVRGLFTLVR